MKKDFYLAPLNIVGNSSFRKLILKYEADFVFTEMIQVDKLFSDNLENQKHQLRKISNISKFELEKTIFQILCYDIDLIERAVKFLISKFDFIKEINYNMGCPQSSLCKNESGGGILKNPEKIRKVGILLNKISQKYNIKTSVKIRIGVDRENISIYENVLMLSQIGIKKFYVHTRTLNESYLKKASFEEIKILTKKFKDLEIIANGDICDRESFLKFEKINCFGVMIGRASLENPYVFSQIKNKNFNCFFTEKIESRKKIILEFLEFAKQDNLSLRIIKTNISYFTKNTLFGAKLRNKINNFSKIDEVISFFENL